MAASSTTEDCCAYRIIIGLDFGATYSGIHHLAMRHCSIHNPNEPYFATAESIGKFPTALKCRDDTLAMTICPDTSKLGNNYHPRELFKMLLLSRDMLGSTQHTAELVSYIKERARGPSSEAEPSDEIVETMNTAFIKGLYDMAIKKATQRDLRFSSEVTVVITYPQCFQGTATTPNNDANNNVTANNSPTFNKFRRAVGAAGFPAGVTVLFASEHMAALRGALLCRTTPSITGFRRGGRIMVVDCGGMSVDAVFHVLPLRSTPESFIRWRSEFGGGVWVDQQVKTAVTTSLQDYKGNAKERKERIGSVMKYWHDVYKPSLDADESSGALYTAVLPFAQVQGSNYYRFEASEIEAMYGRVIDIIVKAVSDLRINCDGKVPQTILYTGGLTRSKYVLYHVKKRLQETGLRDIEMVDSGAISNCVAIGAAAHALSVVEREKLKTMM